MYGLVAALGHNESALLFALLRASSQGVILPERQKTLCLHRDPCIFPTRFLIHFVNRLPLPSPSVMLAANCSENLSVTDTLSTWSAVRQARGERLQIWHWAHKHTFTERERERERKTSLTTAQVQARKKINKRALLYESEISQTKACLIVSLKLTA